ncbi:unnamed protein product [Somion occarium]|uniref:Uncharacterized protein n=1 Tax=Somion occarium TaxID=3059160 RepID=A0ABP1DWM9_9APHY
MLHIVLYGHHFASTKALNSTSPSPEACSCTGVPAPMNSTSPVITFNVLSAYLTVPLPSVTIAKLGPSIAPCVSLSLGDKFNPKTENSGMADWYVSPEMRLGMSRSLGVRPARITLSDVAMHSMMSSQGPEVMLLSVTPQERWVYAYRQRRMHEAHRRQGKLHHRGS